tara:strand:+ start:613 stop:1170 length:558 start_codon:yes stop_codon:yes gene_type:complete
MKELKLIPPNDPRVLSSIADFSDDMLKEHDYKNREEVCKDMEAAMLKYGGIGLSANQVGLPFRMFICGGHPSVEKGLLMKVFNPVIISASAETTMFKEGCLTFPFIFLSIRRPRKVVVKYEDEKGDLREAHLDGMMSRIFQHEFDHMQGIVFTEKVSKLKLDMAKKKATKEMQKVKRYQELNASI